MKSMKSSSLNPQLGFADLVANGYAPQAAYDECLRAAREQNVVELFVALRDGGNTDFLEISKAAWEKYGFPSQAEILLKEYDETHQK